MKKLWERIIQGTSDMLYIWWHETRLMFSDSAVLLFILAVPLVYPLLYSWIYNNEVVREVPTAVVDKSNTHTSREFIRKYDASPDVKVKYRCASLDEARNLVGMGRVYGILYFPADFETKLFRQEQTTVSVYTDMSFMLAYKAIYQTSVAVQGEMNKEIQIKVAQNATSREDEIATAPLKTEGVAIFNPSEGYGSFIIPAVLALIVQQAMLLGVGLAAGTMRDYSRRKKNKAQRVYDKHYDGTMRAVLGRALAFFLISALTTAYLFMVVPLMFSFPSLVHWDALLAIGIPYILACVFFSMMFSRVVPHREDVMLLVVFMSVPLLFLSGISWPKSNIPAFWEAVAAVFPSTFGIRAFVRVNSMGATLIDVSKECWILWIQVAVYFVVTWIIFHFQWLNNRKERQLHPEEVEKREKELAEKEDWAD